MEGSKTIILPTGDVSNDSNLGTYYIDMRPAEVHYTSNIWGGKFDDDGVPMCGNGKGEHFYFPINIAQYGFILHARYLKNPEQEILNKLLACIKKLDEIATVERDYTVWYHKHYEEKYGISPPWASAMAQGELISFYLRMYQLLGKEEYLATAGKAYNYMKISYENGGVRRIDNEGNLWLEEYPSDPPSFVLNGFIYAISGLFDLYRVTSREDVKADIDACILTLKRNLRRFDTGYWSRYDLLKRELVRYYYQRNVHVPQMDVLFQLTGEPLFLYYRDKWLRTLNPFNYFLVKIMYRVHWRVEMIKKLIFHGKQ